MFFFLKQKELILVKHFYFEVLVTNLEITSDFPGDAPQPHSESRFPGQLGRKHTLHGS